MTIRVIKMKQTSLNNNMRTTTTTTSKTFVLWCVILICSVLVQAQQLPEQQQHQQQQKYNQLKYQMQQQQQYDYQQQMQEQKQHYQEQYRQQYEQQQEQLRQLQQEQQANNQSPFHALLPITLPLKQQPVAHQQNQMSKQQLTRYKQQDETFNSPTISTTNTQLLQTSASLVVAPGQKEYFEGASDVQATIKRRAGNRKRKRRPQIATLDIEENENGNDNKNISTRTNPVGVKRRKPTNNQEEQPQKTGLPLTEHDKSNRRVRPTAATGEITTTTTTTTTTTSRTAGSAKSELKNLLKNSVGNMSLSELLQQKNLSLDDLLKGKQNALLALQSTAASAPIAVTKTGYNVRRLPTVPTLSEVMNKPNLSLNFNENNNDANKDTKNKLKFPALHRLKLFGTSSRMTSLTGAPTTTTTKINAANTPTIIASSTTTTRLPLYKKRLQQRPTLKPPALFKPILTSTNTNNKVLEVENAKILEEMTDVDVSTTTTTTTSTSTTTTTTTIKPSMSTSVAIKEPIESRVNYISLHNNNEPNNDNGSNEDIKNVKDENEEHHLEEEHNNNLKTNSIEHDEVSTTTAHANYIDNNSNEAEDVDDLENFFVPPTHINITPRIDFVETNKADTKKNHYTEFNDGVDDRTDILELIEDRRNGNRLFKILEQRNMTLDELIEHRKRGSSQLHLKTIVENQAGLFPGQKIILQDNMDIVTAFENFPHFNLMNLKSVRPDDIKTDSQGSSYFTSIIDIEPTDEVYKDGVGETGDNTKRNKGVEFFPSWKTLALASLSTKPKRNPFYLPPPKLLLDNISQDLDDVDSQENSNNQNIADIKQKVKVPTVVEDENVVEAIENEVARAHDLLDLELSGHGFKRSPAAAASLSQRLAHNQYSQMPAGIRSAIVASAAIVLTSLATFMVIFVVCRWKQHKRRKSSYMKTYNAMKSKMPALSIHSRGSSMRHMDEMVSGIATITQSPTQQFQRQHDLLFPRYNHNDSPTPISTTTKAASVRTNSSLLGNCVGLRKQGLDATLDKCNKNRKTHHHHHHHGFNGTTAAAATTTTATTATTGSTNSLALSLQSSTHNDTNTPNRKINSMDTMDPNSPEVQEYLFDALRNSF